MRTVRLGHVSQTSITPQLDAKLAQLTDAAKGSSSKNFNISINVAPGAAISKREMDELGASLIKQLQDALFGD